MTALRIAKRKNNLVLQVDEYRYGFIKEGKQLDPTKHEDIPGIVWHLTQPDAVWNLAREHAKEAMAIIKALPQACQKKVLCADDIAVRGLVHEGQAEEVLALIKTWPQEAQSEILASPYVIRDLGGMPKRANEIVAIIKALPQITQENILTTKHLWQAPASWQARIVERIAERIMADWNTTPKNQSKAQPAPSM